MSQFTELEELEAFVATQDILAFECENIRNDLISEYLGDESDQRTRFGKSTVKMLLNSMSLAPTKMATFNGRISKNVQAKGWLQQRKVDVKTIKQYAQPSNDRCVVVLFREYT